MRVFKVFASLSLLVSQLLFIVPSVAAASSNIVISQVQLDGASDANHEFIELYNNSALDVDLTNWCVAYSPASDASKSTVGCFTPPDSATKLILAANGYTTLTSQDFEAAVSWQGDITFTKGLAGVGGHLRVFDAANQEIDKLSWGTAVDSAPAPSPADGSVLQRKSSTPGVMQDTDAANQDFSTATPTLRTGSLHEEVTTDLCPNLDGVQLVLPAHYIQKLDGNCVLELMPLQLSELLANAAGTDAGKEFIELYNPTDRTVDLSLYMLHIGANYEKPYSFPANSTIGPGSYAVFYDSTMNFTLGNTAGGVALKGIDNTLIAQTTYADAADDQTWALVQNSWQYTNQPTPGSNNLAMLVEPDGTEAPADTACPAGKYRHPETNRCRNIEVDATAPCDADEYRNPETGRCRKLVTAPGLAPCKDGQYRSEETNRCRNITTASATLAACKEGQERNPDTNRCRNVTAASVPVADYPVEAVKEGASSFIGWWALGGILAVAVGYAGWEWRHEVANSFRRLSAIFTRR